LASIYDVTFLRLLMQRQLAERPQAMRCLQVIDGQAQRGNAVTALQVVVQLGLVDAQRAREVDALTREEIQRGQKGVAQSTSGSFVSGGLPPAPQAPPPSGVRSRPATSSGALPPPPAPLPGAPAPLPGQAAPVPAPPAGPAVGTLPAPPSPGPEPANRPPGPASPETPPQGLPMDGAGWYDLAENGEGLDGFECGDKLGRGPVGATYEGRRKVDAGPVVVKVVSRRFQQHPEVLDSLLNAVRRWQALEHPNVARTLRTGLSNGRNVIVFEKARGKPVSEWLREGPLESRHALRVVFDVAQALAAGRRKLDACWGDVRAEKVYFDGQSAQVTDLGLAASSCLASGFSQFGLSFGHPAYLAPEVLQEQQAEPTDAADVYALGVFFYQMICGRLPFTGEPLDVLNQHFDSPLPPPPKDVTFTTTIAGLILRMTAKTPAKRIADAGAVVTAINQLLEGKPIDVPTGRTAAPITADDWRGRTEKDGAAPDDPRWTESRIQKAPAVGPADLDTYVSSAASELGAVAARHQVSGRLPRELVDAAIANKGKTQVGEKLGRGPCGTAYEGTVPGADGPAVIRVLSKKFQKAPQTLQRTLDALRAAQAIDSPYVVRVLRTEQASGRELVAFARAPGRTLRAILDEKGPLLPSLATDRVIDVARALQAAAAHGIHHGDVRPEKVYVDEDGTARLADFGLAEAACLGAGLGKLGLHFGHPDYLAPEVLQERKKEPDQAADVYALGMLYYELVCGAPPFKADDPKQTLVAHYKKPLPPPPESASVPSAVAELMIRMTAKDPSRRVGDYEALLEELAERKGLDGSTADVDDYTGGPASVEEFDPGGSEGDALSADAWEEVSEPLSRPSGEWDKGRIGKPREGAPAPDEWNPLDSEENDPLAAAIRQASGPEAAGGAAKGAKAKKRSKAAKESGNKTQLLLAVAGVVVIGAALGVLYVTQQPAENGGVTTSPTEGPTTPPPPPPPPPPPVDDEAAKRAATALANLKSDVERHLANGRFREAMAALDDVPDDLRDRAEVAAAVEAEEAAIRQAHDDRLLAEERQVEALVAAEQFQAALKVAQDASAWTIDASDGQGLTELVESKMAERNAPLEAMTLEGFDRRGAEAALEERLRGWGDESLLFDGGGLSLRYRDVTLLAEDLLVSSGPKPAVEGATPTRAPQALVLKGSAERVVVLLDLPLRQVLDVTVYFAVGEEPELLGGQRAATIIGIQNPNRPEGLGYDWGLIPVELDRRGIAKTTTVLVEENRVPPGEDLVMELSVEKQRPAVQIAGFLRPALGSDGDVQKGKPVYGERAGSRGYVAIVAEGIDLYVTGLEVRGQVDPDRLR